MVCFTCLKSPVVRAFLLFVWFVYVLMLLVRFSLHEERAASATKAGNEKSQTKQTIKKPGLMNPAF